VFSPAEELPLALLFLLRGGGGGDELNASTRLKVFMVLYIPLSYSSPPFLLSALFVFCSFCEAGEETRDDVFTPPPRPHALATTARKTPEGFLASLTSTSFSLKAFGLPYTNEPERTQLQVEDETVVVLRMRVGEKFK